MPKMITGKKTQYGKTGTDLFNPTPPYEIAEPYCKQQL